MRPSLIVVAAALVLTGVRHARADDIAAVSSAAMHAAAQHMTAAMMCEPSLGAAYVDVSRSLLRNVILLHGVSADQAIVDANETELAIRRSVVGQMMTDKLPGASAAKVSSVCIEVLSGTLTEAEVAIARFRLAVGVR